MFIITLLYIGHIYLHIGHPSCDILVAGFWFIVILILQIGFSQNDNPTLSHQVSHIKTIDREIKVEDPGTRICFMTVETSLTSSSRADCRLPRREQ